MKTRKLLVLVTLFALSLCLSACGAEEDPLGNIQDAMTDTSGMDFSYSNEDINNSVSETYTTITWTDTDVTITGAGAIAEEGHVTITSAGDYLLTGVSEDASLQIAVGEKDKVTLLLSGVHLTNPKGAVLYGSSGKKVTLHSLPNTENTFTDGGTRTAEMEQVDATIFVRGDLTLKGEGVLTIRGNHAHGVVTKDDLVVTGGTYDIEAVKTALNGHDSVKISGGTFTLQAGTNAISSDNVEDTAKGYISIDGGAFRITAGTDGIQAETVLNISGGSFSIRTGGGSNAYSNSSAKGLKASGDVLISGGSFHIDSADDAIHANNCISISGGALTLSSADDGIHADTALDISGGTLTITKSYEGLESADILIRGGVISVTASDDGLNAGGGNDGSALGRPGAGGFHDVDNNASLTITDGYLLIDASGDGLDSNGSLTITGGITLVSGPADGGNGAMDYGATAKISGGVLIATGSSGMATNFSEADGQGAILTSFSTVSGGSSIAICDENGVVLASFTPKKNYQSVVISTPDLQKGKNYSIVVSGTVTNADANGYATLTTISGGKTVATITLTTLLYGSGGMGGAMPGGGGGGGRPPRW